VKSEELDGELAFSAENFVVLEGFDGAVGDFEYSEGFERFVLVSFVDVDVRRKKRRNFWLD
jgi:hypothetical protein